MHVTSRIDLYHVLIHDDVDGVLDATLNFKSMRTLPRLDTSNT